MVPERDHVGAGSQQPVREARRDPDPVGGVLAVHDADVDLEIVTQRRQQRFERTSARSAHDVGDEEDAQGGDFRCLTGNSRRAG